MENHATALQDNAIHPATELLKPILDFQKKTGKTAGSGFGRGIGLIIAGLFGWLAAIIIPRLFGTTSAEILRNPIIGFGFLLLGIGFPLYGFYLIGKAIFSAKRSITCPFCNKHHTLYRDVRSYVCNCGHVLRFSTDKFSLVAVECPHCKLAWGTTENYGPSNCFSCGRKVEISQGKIHPQILNDVCPDCPALIGSDEYFCENCGALIHQPEIPARPIFNDMSESYTLEATSDGMDSSSLMANSGLGQIVRICWLIENVRANVTPPKPESCEYAIKGKFSSIANEENADIIYLHRIFQSITNANEVISLYPNMAKAVASVLPLYDIAVGTIIKRMEINIVKHNSSFDNYAQWWKDFSKNHNDLVNQLKQTLPTELPALQLWPDPFFVFSGTDEPGTNGTGKRLKLENLDELRQWTNSLAVVEKVKIPQEVLENMRCGS